MAVTLRLGETQRRAVAEQVSLFAAGFPLEDEGVPIGLFESFPLAMLDVQRRPEGTVLPPLPAPLPASHMHHQLRVIADGGKGRALGYAWSRLSTSGVLTVFSVGLSDAEGEAGESLAAKLDSVVERLDRVDGALGEPFASLLWIESLALLALHLHHADRSTIQVVDAIDTTLELFPEAGTDQGDLSEETFRSLLRKATIPEGLS